MSSDLLAEFDSFYQAPQKDQASQARTSSAATDSSFFGGSGGSAQPIQTSDFSQWQASAPQPNNSIWDGLTASQASTNITPAPQDDIWGSFEDQASQTTSEPYLKSQFSYSGYTKDLADGRNRSQKKPGIVRRPTADLFSSNVTKTSQTPSLPVTNLATPRLQPVSKNSYGEVLFDADELDQDDDDDFGDFETGAPEPVAPHHLHSQTQNGMLGAATLETQPNSMRIDLLSVTTPLPSQYPQASKSASLQERNPFAEMGVATQQASTKANKFSRSSTPVTAWPTYKPKIPKADPYTESSVADKEEEWGDFADLPAESPAVQVTKASAGIEEDAWGWDERESVPETTTIPNEVDVAPPTNIPPPSVILALFSNLFDLPQSTLFKAVASQPFSLKNRIISDPTTINFLRAYLLIATVAARIIAGRKLRWKRDTLLAQAMKIGPAAAGGKGGMKLAGVDKAEITREDREATDVVRVWKEYLGRLRSAIAVANSSIHDSSAQLTIPDISENIYVKTQEGGLTAPKQCLICGLKREERINKVDVQVEDSFGEWWVDHWGHRACRNFWLEHESKLKHH